MAEGITKYRIQMPPVWPITLAAEFRQRNHLAASTRRITPALKLGEADQAGQENTQPANKSIPLPASRIHRHRGRIRDHHADRDLHAASPRRGNTDLPSVLSQLARFRPRIAGK